MSTIPETIIIGGIPWKVTICKRHPERDCAGTTHYVINEIILEEQTSHQAMMATLFHEILHVMLDQCGVEPAVLNKKRGEFIAKILGECFMNLFRENPLLIEGILDFLK